MRSVILDGPDSWSQTLVAEGIAERFVPIDFSDPDSVFERCVAAIQAARKVRLSKSRPAGPGKCLETLAGPEAKPGVRACWSCRLLRPQRRPGALRGRHPGCQEGQSLCSGKAEARHSAQSMCLEAFAGPTAG